MALKYKIGDRVRIKSIDWYNENKDKVGNILYKRDSSAYPVFFSKYMSNFCGEILTIKSVFNHSYHMNETSSCEFWTDEMIEGLVEEETKPGPKFKVGDKIKLKSTLLNDIFGVIGYEPEGYRITNISNGLTYFMSYSIEHYYKLVEEEAKPKYEDEVTGEYYSTPKYLVRPNGYRFVDENGNVINARKIVLEKKKMEYPKTYEECCRVLGISDGEFMFNGLSDDEYDLFDKFVVLKRCLDAYWKIAGEEMGLNGPWEPQDTNTFSIFYDRLTGEIEKQDGYCGANSTLEFPTEEMRDAFYENFKEEINSCKEFL